jgi:hypothetical protein
LLSWLVTASAAGLVGLVAGALVLLVMSLAMALFRRS